MKNKKKIRRKENLTGWCFVMPVLTIFLVLTAFPFFFSLFLSFTEWNFLGGLDTLKWVGLTNFTKILADRRFKQALINTVVYMVTTVPTSIAISLVLAYVLDGKIFGKTILKLAFFIPYICSVVALGAVFKALFREEGLVNNILMNWHLISDPIKWSTNAKFSKVPIILLLVWTSIGYELIIYMAAIQNVPRELYEASALDGASDVQKFRYITFPMISPTTFYLLIVRMIAVFKVFSSVNVITMGATIISNTSLVSEIYSNAFGGYKFGYASAEAMVLFVIILIITRINFYAQKKWVHY